MEYVYPLTNNPLHWAAALAAALEQNPDLGTNGVELAKWFQAAMLKASIAVPAFEPGPTKHQTVEAVAGKSNVTQQSAHVPSWRPGEVTAGS